MAVDDRRHAEKLVIAAEQEHADLLVVGSRGYGPLRRLVNGSTSVSSAWL